MIFLYTGAGKFEGVQLVPDRSLGGYISGSEIPDSLLSNLFDQITTYTKRNNKTETRVIAIQNDSGGALTNFKLWADYSADSDSNNDAYLKVGYASPKVDDCGDLYIDNIGNSNANPRGVELFEADGEENALNLPNLADDGYLIIYIQRILNPDSLLPLSNDDLISILDEEIVLEKEEEIQLNFSWD